MYADELNPEDLFNMFFGGGGRGGQFGGDQFGNANGMIMLLGLEAQSS
jgi:DnaJ family protein B protein 12